MAVAEVSTLDALDKERSLLSLDAGVLLTAEFLNPSLPTLDVEEARKTDFPIPDFLQHDLGLFRLCCASKSRLSCVRNTALCVTEELEALCLVDVY